MGSAAMSRVLPPRGGGMDRIVIVGAGAAGMSAAAALREEGFPGAVTVVGAEKRAPYARPAVSKQVLSGELPPDQARLRPAQWYAARGIELMLGETVTSVDPERTVAGLSDGTVLPY